MRVDFHSDLKWCIENDFQVYVQPMNNSGYCKIAIRKGGISTDGKPSKYCTEKQITLYSKETLGSVTYKTQKLAAEKLPDVYSYLRKTYGRI
jgi:hypothetical protein